MTARMSQARNGRSPRSLRRGLVCTLAAVGAWSVGIVGLAPAALAADAQTKQWYLEGMRAEEMWKTTTGEGIKVAVIDSGVNPSTPSLKGQVLKGVNATEEAAGGSTDDYDGQGTTTAELIAGTGNGGGLRGLAPGAKIIPVRIPLLKHDAVPQINDPLARAIKAAADSDAQIINISVGNEHAIGLDMFAQHSALEYAVRKGKLLIAGVGDTAKKGNKAQYPARFPEVVGVAPSRRDGRATEYSQHGKFVDLAAPGVDIPRWCDAKFQSYCDDGGGSTAATAIASASAALIWSAHPDWTANQVLRVLFDTAGRSWETGTRSTYLGHGLIRPRKVIIDGKGNPGAPDAKLFADEVMPIPSRSPKPSAPASSQARKAKPGGDAVVAGSSEKAEDDGQLGLIIGAAAAAAIIAGGAFAVARKRRNS
ncbi:S8 family serine peptidase [Streptomyces sp. ISL-98]|uniref:S8 family serine peptidase n=1 Tax=Streptomyces sp. ISL-98 TaxID=2819192 RepID=UPI001BE55F4B|nr:S8 family serine peptidase [Streptomyces sp. ISL-98]MBT2506948.1 S8 family serine peptidase [Streptomyces sp. ISL-98]